jgi:hypothetical protein
MERRRPSWYNRCFGGQSCPHIGFNSVAQLRSERDWYKHQFLKAKARISKMEQVCILAKREIDKLRKQVATLEAEKQMLENKLKEQRQKPFRKNTNKVKHAPKEEQLFLFDPPCKIEVPQIRCTL